MTSRPRIGRDGGAFGLWWFWYAAMTMLTVTAAAAIIAVVVDQRAFDQVSAAEAARYHNTSFRDISEFRTGKIAVIGDSWSAGAGSSTGNQTTSYIGMALATIDNPYNIFGDGGSGYTVASQYGPAYAKRTAEVVSYDPALVIVEGSINDVNSSSEEVEAAARATFSALHKGLPDARIVALGPSYAIKTDDAGVLRVSEAVRAAANAANVPFVDPIAEKWLPTDAKNFASDGYHPNQTGHNLLEPKFLALVKKYQPK